LQLADARTEAAEIRVQANAEKNAIIDSAKVEATAAAAAVSVSVPVKDVMTD
jgi:F0F1-type ATP synthase membrane subunit b/b'